MESARYAVEVVAGLIPGQAMPEFTRQFFVSSSEWRLYQSEGPQALTEAGPWQEARKYAESLVDPDRLNWVSLSWVWF